MITNDKKIIIENKQTGKEQDKKKDKPPGDNKKCIVITK